MDFRVGFGYDVHKLVKDHPFFIGGIAIEHHKGAFGHSDADVLIHSICDAILGAANLGDIGTHFPDTDPQYKGIDSKKLLKATYDLVQEHGWQINNLDNTVVLEQPKLKPLIPQMRQTLAQILEINETLISIKATTSEKMGFVGVEDGIASYSVVLLKTLS